MFGHALLGQKIDSSCAAWQVQINDQLQPYIQDHKVSGNTVYPGAAYIETALAAAYIIHQQSHTVLEALTFSQALVLQDDQVAIIEFTVDSDKKQFSIAGSQTQARAHWTLHAQGQFLLSDIELQPENIDLESVKKRCTKSLVVDDLYYQLDQRGLQYGPTFQGIHQLWKGDDIVLAKINAAPTVVVELDQYRLHPAVLDACFQSLIVISDTAFSDAVFVPVSIERVEFYQSPSASFYSVGQLMLQSDQSFVGDLTLCDESGRVYAKVKGLCCQALPNQESATLTDCLYHYQWKTLALSNLQDRDVKGSWLIISDEQVFSSTLEAILLAEQVQLRCIVTSLDDVDVKLSQISSHSLAGVIYHPSVTIGESDEVGIDGTFSFSHLCQKLLAQGISDQCRLYLISALENLDTESAEQQLIALSQASLVGVGRVIMTEHPELHLTMIDVPVQMNGSELKTLTRLLCSENTYQECLIKKP